MNKSGKRYAFKVVSKGIVDDLFAFRFSLTDNKFRWNQAKKLGERRNHAKKMVKIIGNPKRAKQVSMQISDSQLKRFILDVGQVKFSGFRKRKRLNSIVRNVFMAESRGSHQAALNYISQARKWGLIK